MRVVVFGAGGFLGNAVVRSFSRADHVVIGVVHQTEHTRGVVAAGGEPRIGDILDPASVAESSLGCDVAIHLAQPSAGDLDAMRRVRVGGAQTLLSALPRSGVRRLVVGSGYWVYADNPEWIAEDSPLRPMSISQVNFETEEAARHSGPEAMEIVIVRPGMVYGPGSWFAQMIEELTAGTFRYVGDGRNFMSPIHWSDAGDAFRSVCERWTPGETYLAVDDQPVEVRRFAGHIAETLGTTSPQSMPLEEARRLWGEELALLNLASRRASNRKLKNLGWSPLHPESSAGVASVLREMNRGAASDRCSGDPRK